MKFFSLATLSPPPASQVKNFYVLMFLGVAGGTIERSCYSPHYVNAEVDYERDYQETLPQGPAQQLADASPVTGTPTAVAIGSGSAASVG